MRMLENEAKRVLSGPVPSWRHCIECSTGVQEEIWTSKTAPASEPVPVQVPNGKVQVS